MLIRLQEIFFKYDGSCTKIEKKYFDLNRTELDVLAIILLKKEFSI